MVLAPFPFLLVFLGLEAEQPPLWRVLTGIAACLACLACALTLFRKPTLGPLLGGLSCVLSLATVFPHASKNPFVALTSALVLILVATTLFQPFDDGPGVYFRHAERSLERARWASLASILVVALVLAMATPNTFFEGLVIAAAAILAQGYFWVWVSTSKLRRRFVLPFASFAALLCSIFFLSEIYIAGTALVAALFTLVVLPQHHQYVTKDTFWWDILLDRPSRFLFTTFFSLCALGTLALMLPAASKAGAIEFVDAVFTAVSAVCVTGLIVLDTPNDFTFFGQFAILVLIQLGGLGIMSISSVALHAMGRRLSLRQERLLTTMTDFSHRDLLQSLRLILKFTFIAEVLGAMALSIFFYLEGDPLGEAIWRGVFTAVSAFCNAGFALQSDSLMAYQTHPFMLHITAILIILGGLAPATSLILPRWLRGKRVPIPARLALLTTTVLLLVGTGCMLAFEWNGLFAEMSLFDKIHNAWFQSATLRTAGFNSVDIANAAAPTLLVMIVFMLIGGSPGGTAGGLKTTTFAILAMTFWANIGNRTQVVTQKRRIHPHAIARAITVVVAGGIIWFLILLMLEITQQIPAGNLIFEATSAIGTVGLSTGATPLLDEIGKVIIIVAMFAGRLGPVTMFMLLAEERSVNDTRYPIERISIP